MAHAQTAANPNRKIHIIRPNAPAHDEVRVGAVYQTAEGPLRHLRVRASLETPESLLTADEMDYNEETGYAEARGHVVYKNYNSGELLRCERAEYDVNEEVGKFYVVSGVVPAAIQTRPGILSSDNPFIFEGKWAEKVEDRYFLYDGIITSCKLPKPWWTLRGPKFDIIPNDRAITQRAMFRLRGIPIFYTPYFYKSMKREERKSGFLMPNIGNSSRRGFMFGIGYYWAMSRSYDLTYRPQYFSNIGFAHMLDFRGKPTQKSDFNFQLYGVNDKSEQKAGGLFASFFGRTELRGGWQGYALVNYLSSFKFRTSFSESYNEAIFTEVRSTAYLTKHWNGYGINAIFDQVQNFQSINDGDTVSIRKLPEIQFFSQDRQITRKFPLWFSFNTSASLLRRNQPLFQTRQAVERFDLGPRLMSSLQWKHFEFVPSIQVRETYWGSSFANAFAMVGNNQVTGNGLWRNAFQAEAALIFPSLARVFDSSGWFGEKFKHVIEPRVDFHYVTGVNDFSRTIRFDDAELLTNTNDVEISITNRFYSKKKGITREWGFWEVWQRRYFDQDFGGAIVPGTRNVVAASAGVTGYAFLDGPRNYSPIASNFRMEPVPGFGVAWRMDYDPLQKGVTNNAITADTRFRDFFVSAGHNQVKTDPVLSPPANQFRSTIGWGRGNRRGWNTAFSTVYDYRLGITQFMQTQVTYNSDCCGFSVQYRRFNFGNRFENQYRFSLAISNIANFGTLRRQDALF